MRILLFGISLFAVAGAMPAARPSAPEGRTSEAPQAALEQRPTGNGQLDGRLRAPAGPMTALWALLRDNR
jgi:hypothetical protein